MMVLIKKFLLLASLDVIIRESSMMMMATTTTTHIILMAFPEGKKKRVLIARKLIRNYVSIITIILYPPIICINLYLRLRSAAGNKFSTISSSTDISFCCFLFARSFFLLSVPLKSRVNDAIHNISTTQPLCRDYYLLLSLSRVNFQICL